MALTKLQGFSQPGSLREAAKLLHQLQDSALIIGGGTFIHGLVARGLVTDIEHMVDLSKLGLNHIELGSKVVVLGASTTFAQIECHDEITASTLLGAISDAMTYPPPQVKNAATVGGCVAASCPFLDLPVALLALDATAVVMGRRWKRKVPLEELFVSLFGSSLKVGEFITEITLPQLLLPTASAFQKLETTANDLAILNAAVRVSLQDGRCVNLRVFIGGGVGETAVRSEAVEAVLDGQPLGAALIEAAAEAAIVNFDPLSDHRASAEYRKLMAKVFIRRCLLQICERLKVEVECNE